MTRVDESLHVCMCVQKMNDTNGSMPLRANKEMIKEMISIRKVGKIHVSRANSTGNRVDIQNKTSLRMYMQRCCVPKATKNII